MQSETGFPSSHQLKSYVASKSRLELAAHVVLSADAGLLVPIVDTCLSCEYTARQSCAMVLRWRFLWPHYVIGQAIIFLPCGIYLFFFLA